MLLIGGGVYWLVVKPSLTPWRDFRVAYVDDEGVMIKSVSWQRKMINIVRIGGDVQMWIPGGLGWYESGKLRRLLAQEKQGYRIGEILFYNLGFDSDLTVFNSENDWRDFWIIGNNWGWNNFLAYLFNGKGRLMVKEERVVTGQLSDNEGLGIIMLRDMADSAVVESGVKVSIMNTGMANGLASFLARNLERAGITVYGVETNSRDLSGKKCVIEYGDEVDGTVAGSLLFKYFDLCDRNHNQLVGNSEIELYLGDKFAEVINYQSYSSH
jgi:hypothetical protein